jgi:NAD(P)-dependent dehydrogenase (short-subunit alcohol dehydrogenase family)
MNPIGVDYSNGMDTGSQTPVGPPLAGKVALVTGGSRGIGLAIARAIAHRGAKVVITGREDAALAAASRHRPANDGVIRPVRADVRSHADAARAVDEAARAFGGLDVLVNNAGVGLFAPVADMSIADWQQVIETNLTGVFYCCREAIPHLRRRGGWIINISSLAGKNAFAGGAAYCASKAALNQFTDVLMQEVRYDGIRVSCIAPGSVSTGFSGRGASGEAEWKLAPEDVALAVLELLEHPPRSLPSRIELRPSTPPKK